MSTMTGADADALDAAAGELRSAADQLDASAAKLTKSLGLIQWLGQVAVRFADLWSSGHRPRLTTAATFLRENADILARQALEQRRASTSDGGSGPGGLLATFGRQVTAILAVQTRMRAVADALAPTLLQMRGLSGAEQLAWWNSLTDDQRAALLTMRPGELTALAGLPPDVLAKAQANYTSSIADEILTEKKSVHGEIEASIKIVTVGAGFDVEQRTYEDGSVELDLSAFLKAGVGSKDAEALAHAGVGGVWEFDSQADADRFIEGLKREIVPSGGEVIKAWGNVGAASVKSLLGYLDKESSHLGSVSASAGTSASVSAGGFGAGIGAEVKVSVDTRGSDSGDVTISANRTLDGKIAPHGGNLGVAGDLKIEASATFDGTTPKSLTFSMEYKNAVLAGVFSPVAEVSAGATHSGTAEITFDLTRPELQAAAETATAALKRGDVAGATAALSGVMDQAQITMQDMVGVQTTASFDAKVVSGELSAEISTVTSTQVKPPGGSFYEVK